MATVEITLQLPDSIYQQMRQIADASGQPLDAVMLEMYTMLANQPLDLPIETAWLDNYTDAQLWGVVYRRLPEPLDNRWQELLAIRDDRTLTPSEDEELLRLMTMSDQYMLYRSKALLLLQQRGYDTIAYLRGQGA